MKQTAKEKVTKKTVPKKAGKNLVASTVRASGESAGKSAGASTVVGVNFYPSSKARAKWSEMTKKALKGEPVAILIGGRALVLKEVVLSYAEIEYGVTKGQLNAKADEIERRGCEEIDNGKASEVT